MHSFARSRKAVLFSSLAAVSAFGLLVACSSDETEPEGSSSSSSGGSATTDSGPSASSSSSGDAASRPDAAVLDGAAQPDAGPALSEVHTIGRFDRRDAAGPKFGWAGSGLVARFQGTGISIRLRGVVNDHQFTVVVDGVVTRLVLSAADSTYTLAEGLPAGEHTVEVHRRTEALFGPTQFLGFTVAGGALVPSPPPASRHIEFIGDSITNGYGNEGANAACGFSAETENEYLAFGARTARTLSATHTAIAWSGRGLRVNYDDAPHPPVPALFERTLADEEGQPWDFSQITPAVVVVYLGTNDTWRIADPGVEFTSTYTTFLGRIRSVYPAAAIFVAAAPERAGVVTRARAAVEARNGSGDAAVHFFQFDPYDSALGIGCDHHPSAASHAVMAEKLSAAIRAVTGW